jgi:hypothetical protein
MSPFFLPFVCIATSQGPVIRRRQNYGGQEGHAPANDIITANGGRTREKINIFLTTDSRGFLRINKWAGKTRTQRIVI